MTYEIEVAGRARQVNVRREDGRFVVVIDGREQVVDAARVDGQTLSLLIGQASYEVTLATNPVTNQLAVVVGTTAIPVSFNGRRRSGRKEEAAAGTGPQRIVAPMPGKIVKVLVSKGDRVQPRQPLVVIEAMKMENELRASGAGAVAELHVQEGQSVDAGTLVALVGPA